MSTNITNIYSRIQPLLLTFFVILFNGCASQVNMLPTLSETTTFQPHEGLVVARVINASGYPLPFNHLTIAPKNLNESKEIKAQRLVSPALHISGTTVFASPVKAGSYALSNIRAFHSAGDYWYSRFVSSNATFGTFEVKPGQVTDLGTIVYYPKSQDDKYINTLIRIPETSRGEVLRKYFSFHNINNTPISSWNDDELEQERQSQYVSVARNPVVYPRKYLAPDQSLYFLGKLGIIIKRTSKGEWELDAVDTNLDLLTIAQNELGDLAVGGSEGHIFWKKNGDDWQPLSLDHDYQVDKLLFRDTNTLDVLAHQRHKLVIFRQNLTQAGNDWKELDHYTPEKGWKSIPIPEENITSIKKRNPRKIMGASLSEHLGNNYLTVYSLSDRQDPVFNKSKKDIFIYTKDWSFTPSRSKNEISTIIDAGTIKLGIKEAGFWSFTGRDKYFKYIEDDNGWQEISTHMYKCNGEITDNGSCFKNEIETPSKKASFNFRTTPWFRTDTSGIAIVSFSSHNSWSGERSSETKILSTNDGGLSWQLTDRKLPADYCATIVPEVTDRILISCNGASGDFYESLDEGESWEHVRQHENF